MTTTHQCCFLNLQNTQCGRHRRPELFEIRYSPKLRLWLCAEHEKCIVHDHIRHLLHKFSDQQSNYQSFSSSIINRFLDPAHISHIPAILPITQTLFRFTITNINATITGLNIRYSIDSNDIAFIQNCENKTYINFQPIVDINSIFENLTYLHNEQQSEQINSDTDTQQDLNVDSSLVNMFEEIIESNVVTHTFENIQLYFNLPRTITLIRETTNTIIKCDLTNIDECQICNVSENQKGFGMQCCNADNKVCVKCIMNDYLTKYNEHYEYTQIKDCSIFQKSKKCFFCRKECNYTDIIDDNECKTIFIDLVEKKQLQDIKCKIEDLIRNSNLSIDTLRRNLGQ